MKTTGSLSDNDLYLRTRIKRRPVSVVPQRKVVVDTVVGSRPHHIPQKKRQLQEATSALANTPKDKSSQHQDVLIRQFTSSYTPLRAKKRTAKQRQFFRPVVALRFMAVMIFVAGLFVSFNGWQANKQVTAQVEALQSKAEQSEDKSDSSLPKEAKPDDFNIHDYKVASDMPRFIRITKINVFARVMRVGVNDKNQMMAPGTIYDAGWYDGSSKPGQSGAALIDGHVHGLTAPGVFYGLKNLTPGDEIEIELGSGKKITYEVTGAKSYPAEKTDMTSALQSSVPGKPGLNIITCDGELDSSDNSYKDRLIVYSVLK